MCGVESSPVLKVCEDISFHQPLDAGERGCACYRLRKEDFKVHYYAFPSSTFTAWGLIAPVRAGLACPAVGRDSWSLLVNPTGGALPSPTALRTSRMVLV